MTTVTVSPKFQIVIPREVRESLNLKPGDKVHVFCHDERIEIIPAKDIRGYRGFLRGMDTTLEQEPDRL